MIAYKPKGVEFKNWKPLLYGYAKNKDGVGLSILREGAKRFYTNKTFKTFHEFWRYYKKNVAKNDIAIIHFRWATHGNKDTGNRHPFPVTTDRNDIRLDEFESDDIIAHNGVISDMSKHCLGKSIYSDTQEFIIRVFAPLRDFMCEASGYGMPFIFNNEAIYDLVDAGINGSRLIYMHADGLIKMWGSWVEDGGIFYSNDGFKTRPAKFSKRIGFGVPSYFNKGSHGVDSAYDEEYWNSGDFEAQRYFPRFRGSARRCEECKKLEGAGVKLKKHGGRLLCGDCRDVHDMIYGNKPSTGLSTIDSNLHCENCKKTPQQATLIQRGTKWYCSSCLSNLVADNVKNAEPEKSFDEVIEATIIDEVVVCCECGEEFSPNSPDLIKDADCIICKTCLETISTGFSTGE